MLIVVDKVIAAFTPCAVVYTAVFASFRGTGLPERVREGFRGEILFIDGCVSWVVGGWLGGLGEVGCRSLKWPLESAITCSAELRGESNLM